MRKILLICWILLLVPAWCQSAEQVRGFVYVDSNRNGSRDAMEVGLSGVRVSNGEDCVLTDAEGSYSLSVSDDTVIFVIKPRNYMTAVDSNNVPRFYYIHRPKGTPRLKYAGTGPTGELPGSVDFPLYPRAEPSRFEAVFMGDPQVAHAEDVGYMAHDIVEEIRGGKYAFSVSLGDIAGNDLSLYPQILPVMGKMGMPCYYVKGNHDTNYDAAPNPRLITSTFEKEVGPAYYSFDYGPVHFVVLNNPFFTFPKVYHAELDSRQMQFLQNDLKMLPRKQLVVLMMHIPISNMKDKQKIYDLLKEHPNSFSISGHTHTQQHLFIELGPGKNAPVHHHLINGAACGSWWSGIHDEQGLPHTTMRDGCPNGYSVISFNGDKYSVRFKAARRPAEYQMNIYAPDKIKAADIGQTEVLVNVFAGSSRSKVEMRLEGEPEWTKMEQVRVADPAFEAERKRENKLNVPAAQKLPKSGISHHIWSAKLPAGVKAGTYTIEVRTTDMFGNRYSGCRIINIR